MRSKGTGSGKSEPVTVTIEPVKPNILIITDSKILTGRLAENKVTWSFMICDSLTAFESQLDTNKVALENADLIIVMMGREDIVGGAEGLDLLSHLCDLIGTIEELEIPLMVSHILPIKGSDPRTEVNILNSGITSMSECNIIDLQKTFGSCVEDELFPRMKINIRENWLNAASNILEKSVGIPSIRDKCKIKSIGVSDNDKTDSDSGVIIEFLPLLPFHAQKVRGDRNETIRDLQRSLKADISVINYTYKDVTKHGALVSGDDQKRFRVKSKIADIISTVQDTNHANKRAKRGVKPDPMSWAKKLKPETK